MLGWIARLVDPVYRKSQNPLDSLKTQLPVLSKTVPPYETPFGDVSERDFPFANALSPLRISKDKPLLRKNFNQRQVIKIINSTLEDGKVPKGKVAENKELLHTLMAESAYSQVNRALEGEKSDTLQDLVDDGLLPSGAAKKYLELQQLEKAGLSRKDRELLLYSGSTQALLIIKRLNSFTKDKTRAKHARLLIRLNILTSEVAREMQKIQKSLQEQEQRDTKKDANKKVSLQTSSDTKNKIILAAKAGGLNEKQIAERLIPFGYSEKEIHTAYLS